MIQIDNGVEWAECDVMRVGYATRASNARLEIGDRVAVLMPGGASLSVDAAARGRRYSGELRGGFVTVLPPCSRLDIEDLAPGSVVVMTLDAGFVAEGLGDSGRALCGQARSIDPYLTRIGSTLRSAFRVKRAPPPAFLEHMAGGIREHLCRFYTRRRRKQAISPLRSDRLELATQYMREHHQDKDLSVTGVAASVGLSAFHFTRMFTKATGKAPHAYLTQVRLEHARQLLGATCLPIAEIANRCGYATHAHFTGVFGRHVGMTPATYRTQVRAERAAARVESTGNR